MSDVSLLRWFERADLPPDQAAERARIMNEIKQLYERNAKGKEYYRNAD